MLSGFPLLWFFIFVTKWNLYANTSSRWMLEWTSLGGQLGRKRLSGQVVQLPTLEVFKTKMDKALNILVSRMSLFWAAGWTRDLLKPKTAWIILGPQDNPVVPFSRLPPTQLRTSVSQHQYKEWLETDSWDQILHWCRVAKLLKRQHCPVNQTLCQASENWGIPWERLFFLLYLPVNLPFFPHIFQQGHSSESNCLVAVTVHNKSSF